MAKAWTPRYTQAEEDAIDKLVKDSGLTRDFVVWYLSNSNLTAMDFYASFGDKAGTKLQGFRQLAHVDKGYNAWLAERAAQTTPSEEATFFGIGGEAPAEAITNPLEYLAGKLGEQITLEAQMAGMDVPAYLQYLRAGGERPGGGLRQGEDQAWELASGKGNLDADTSAVTSQVGEVFSALTPEQLDDIGAEGISEKFGLQQLAVQEPEAFLQAMFDKAGISPSPPIYAFLRDMMPSIVLLASTREGQDILKSPGGAVELNKAVNEVMSQGFPSRQSVMGGLQEMGGFARELLGGGYESGRGQFNFVMGTLDALLGPTMAEPLRRALFSGTAATQQGDRFLSASARGIFTGDFIDWLKSQGYPIPELPAYKPTPGATATAAAAPFVEGEVGTSSSGAPFFPVSGGTYE